MWQLYVILDPSAARGRELAWLARQAIEGGADVLQLREKTASTRQLIEHAKTLLAITRAAGIPLVVNDRPDVAVAVGADGAHVGQDDLPVAEARALIGPGQLLGQSTHSLPQALTAEAEPVDYLACGPIFATPTKPDYGQVGLTLLRDVLSTVLKPVVAIGGIDETTLPAVLEAGAQCVAVVRAVCGAENPKRAAQHLKTQLGNFRRAE